MSQSLRQSFVLKTKGKPKHSRREKKEIKRGVKNFLDEGRESHRVRYIAQEDMSGFARKRVRWGAPGIRYFLSLEGSTMSIFKEKIGPPKHEFNVRNVKVVCRKSKNGSLLMHVGGKVLEFVLEDVDSLDRWRKALGAAVASDIEDNYRFGRAIGRGAFGEVVEAFKIDTNEKRAIKIIQRSKNDGKETHLLKEIEVLKAVNHDNIVTTYEIFNLKRAIYIVMEHVSGGDLFDFISKKSTLSENQASQVMKSLIGATMYLHERSIVHRDLKPENILCVNDQWPLKIKVTDFGFASFANDRNLMTTSVGTAYFMAPEIITRSGYGLPVDLYACGVILYTILTGRLPYTGRNLTEYFRNVVKGDVKFPAMLWRGVSPAAKSFVLGLLQHEPDKRLTAFAALRHSWIDKEAPHNSIKRDRSNLHHSNRKLLKPRAAYVVVSMVHKVKRIHELRYGLVKIPVAIDAVERGAKKTVGAVEKGAKKTVGVVEKSAKKTAHRVEKGAKKTKEGAKKIGRGIRKKNGSRPHGHNDSRKSRRKRKRRARKRRQDGQDEPHDIATGLKKIAESESMSSESETEADDQEEAPSDAYLSEDPTSRASGTTTRTQSTESFVTAATSFKFRRVADPDYQARAAEHARARDDQFIGGTALLTSSVARMNRTRSLDETMTNGGEGRRDIHDVLCPPNLSSGDPVVFEMDRPPAGLLRLLQRARRRQIGDMEKGRRGLSGRGSLSAGINQVESAA